MTFSGVNFAKLRIPPSQCSIPFWRPMLSWKPLKSNGTSQPMLTAYPLCKRNPLKDQRCLTRKEKDVPNSRASASGVLQATIWFPSASCPQTFRAILANSQDTFLPYVKKLPLSGRQLQTILLIQISCSCNIRPARQFLPLLPLSISLGRDIKTSISLLQSFRCDWQQLTSRDRAC